MHQITNMAADKYSFVGSVTRLMAHMVNVLSKCSVDGAIRQIREYKKRFEATTETVHHLYFHNILKDNLEDILSGADNDRWLLEKDIEIVFGSEFPNTSRKGVLPLTRVYQASLECSRQAKTETDPCVIFPEIFKLHLYRIFVVLASKYDEFRDHAETLKKIMRDLEGELSSPGQMAPLVDGNSDNNPKDSIEKMLQDPALDGIINMVSNGLLGSGLFPAEVSEQMKQIDIKQQMRQMMSNDGMMSVLNMMNDNISKAKTPEEAMKTGMSFMTDPNIMKKVMQAGGATTQDIEQIVPKMTDPVTVEEMQETMQDTIVNTLTRKDM